MIIRVEECQPRRSTIYDLNPHTNKYLQFFMIFECDKCKRSLAGRIVLDKVELKVQDTSGFMIDQVHWRW